MNDCKRAISAVFQKLAIVKNVRASTGENSRSDKKGLDDNSGMVVNKVFIYLEKIRFPRTQLQSTMLIPIMALQK